MNLHVHLDYLADPFCCRHGDWYYAVATGKAECYSPPFEGPHVVPMVKSRDLRQWERVGRVLELPPAVHLFLGPGNRRPRRAILKDNPGKSFQKA